VFVLLSAVRWAGVIPDVAPAVAPGAVAGMARAALGALSVEPVLAAVPVALALRWVLGRVDAA